jgi:hypothetical protein
MADFTPTHIGLGFGEKVMITDCEHVKRITHADGFWYLLNPQDAAENFTPIDAPLFLQDGTVLR